MSAQKDPQIMTYIDTTAIRVVHVITDPKAPENAQGSIIRVYVNDERVFENKSREGV